MSLNGLDSQAEIPGRPNARCRISLVLFGALACMTVAVFFHSIPQTPFDIDEILYLHASGWFDAWRSLEFSKLLHVDASEIVISPIAPLLAGASRELASAPVAGPYFFPAGHPDPLSVAIMPPPELLLIVRLPMAMAGVASTLLMTALIWRARGAVTGMAAGLMLIANSTYTTFNQRLLTEAPLLLFTVLAFVAAARAARNGRILWWAAAGCLAGLAMASKQTGLLTVVAVAFTTAAPIPGNASAFGARLIRALAAVATSAIVVIALHPYAWANPIAAARSAIEARLSEINRQRGEFPSAALNTLDQRLAVFTWRVFTHGAALGCAQAFDRDVAVDAATNQWRSGVYVQGKLLAYTAFCIPELGAAPVLRPLTWLNMVLFAAGIALVLRHVARRRRWAPAAALGWMALYMGVTVVSVPFSWYHYYGLPIVAATLLQAVAIGAGAQKLLGFARRRVR